MKKGIHPAYYEVDAISPTGEVYKIKSTVNKTYYLDVDSKTHPFYTGKQRVVSEGGRVDAFKKRFKNFGSTKK